MKLNYCFVLLAGFAIFTGLAAAQTPVNPSQVQTQNGVSIYYWTYPASTPGVTLPGQVPDGQVTPGLAVAVQSSDPTVTEFVVTVSYVDSNATPQTTLQKFAATAGAYATGMFPIGVIQSVTSISVVPVVAEIVFPAPPSSNGGSGGSNGTNNRRAPAPVTPQARPH
jgi:hypothetical protein